MSDRGGSAPPVCGVLLVDKPAGITSHDVVARVRRLTGIRKVGHGGTLDPFATGLMLVLVGRATKLFDLLLPLSKRYRLTAQFGATSTTGDRDGGITPHEDAASVSGEALEAILPRFMGTIKQQVPAYSAVKVAGEPLYRKARRGQAVDLPVREVEIRELDLVSFDATSRQAVLDVACSRGTYVRQLCEDIGDALGAGAYAQELRRTAVGDFRVDDALTLEELERLPGDSLFTGADPAFISCAGALYFLPGRKLDESDSRAVTHGQPIAGTEDGLVRLFDSDRLLAIYGPGEKTGLIYPRVVLV